MTIPLNRGGFTPKTLQVQLSRGHFTLKALVQLTRGHFTLKTQVPLLISNAKTNQEPKLHINSFAGHRHINNT